MLFWIELDGVRVAVQAVNRKPKPFWRLAPYTIVYPTPKQKEVRNTVAKGAHKAISGTTEDVNLEVRASFTGWEYARKPANTTYEALKAIYGSQADDVLLYIQAQKKVEGKIRNPLFHERMAQAIERELMA